MKKRTKALQISQKVREEVKERDKWCVICGHQGQEIAHYISRSQGGLGIKENLIWLCKACHMRLDGADRKMYRQLVKDYLLSHYPDFPDIKRIYEKYQD